MLNKISIKLFPILLMILAIVVCIQLVTTFIVDIFWFQELGYLNILFKKIQTEIISGFLIFCISLVFIFSNLNCFAKSINNAMIKYKKMKI